MVNYSTNSTYYPDSDTTSFIPAKLAYYPRNDVVDKIMDGVSEAGISVAKFNTSLKDIISTVADEAYEYYSAAYLGVVVFDLDEDATSLPPNVGYKLRPLTHYYTSWHTDLTYPSWPSSNSRSSSSNFLELQYAIDRAIIRVQLQAAGSTSNQSLLLDVKMKQFPYPEYTFDPFLQFIQLIMPILICVAFLYTAGTIVKEIVLEKHDRLKESMKMMGLSNWIHWLAWFFKSFICLLIIMILVVIVIKFANIYPKSDPTVILVFFLLWMCAAITWNFAVATCLTRPKLAVLAGAVLWFLNFLPVFFINAGATYSRMAWYQKALGCLLCNTCMGIGINLIALREVQGVGAQWNNLAYPVSVDDDFPLSTVFAFFVLSFIIHTVIAWQVEAIFPGKYGVPKPFYFSCLPSYWCGPSETKKRDITMEYKLQEDVNNSKNHETEPTDLNIGISIHNLRKVYKSLTTGSKLAVDNLSLNMYEGQITSLLGHNGAGKTTTMSILTGLFPPTSGSATINGYSILTDIDKVRQSLGLCPQHNVLFDRLTVKEHLDFFIALKGVSGSAGKKEVNVMINDLNLTDKTNQQSSKLSGGMKRKLSCGIALIGGSKIVILDEPTSGMDPYARRATWDLLLKHKEGRTILLTTHFMDEADLLGDRIAIMANGELICSGSSLFLKNKYGVGYHMTLVKTSTSDTEMVDKFITSYVPDAKCTSNVGSELSYTLPKESTGQFKDMFEELESKMADFGINSYGVSVTTMEEVFMKVGEMAEEIVQNRELQRDDSQDNAAYVDGEHQRDDDVTDVTLKETVATARGVNTDNLSIDINVQDKENQDHLTGVWLLWQQFKAMFMKRLLSGSLLRNRLPIATQLVLPLFFVVIAQVVTFYKVPRQQDPERILDLSNLYSSDVGNSKAFYVNMMENKSEDVIQYQTIKDFLSSVKVDTIDVTGEVLKIMDAQKSEILYPSQCCENSPFMILNPKCIAKFLTDVYDPAALCSNSTTFGYRYCMDCLQEPVQNYEYKEPDVPESQESSYSDDFLQEFSRISSSSFFNCPHNPIQNLEDINTYFQEYVLRESDTETFYKAYVAGMSVGNDSIIVWYSNEGYHTTAETLNAVSNIALQSLTNSSFSIQVSNYPLPRSSKDQAEDQVWDAVGSFSAVMQGFLIILGVGFLAASFIPFIVQEKRSKAKHVQIVSGLNQVVYWLANFAWDYLNYLVIAVVFVIIVAAFDSAEMGVDGVGPLIAIMLLFGWAMLPCVYTISFLFTSPIVAFFIVMIFLGVIMAVCLIIAYILSFTSEEGDNDNKITDNVLFSIPTYALGKAMQYIVNNGKAKHLCTETEEQRQACAAYKVTFANDTFQWESPGLGKISTYLAVEGVVYFLIVLLLEHFGGFLPYCIQGKPKTTTNTLEDEDVANERQRVTTLDPKSDDALVLIKDLSKVYRGKCCIAAERPAVDGISVAIPKGECFGLLGINGAGKTTTFSMLTGDLGITSGTAFIDGHNIQTSKRKAQQRMGYCPQFDGLIDKMTGRELLTMYARLRGIPSSRIDAVVKETIKKLDLDKWADKLAGQYSGGNKRKLSTASAVVGDPAILFLDEPTTGMDPKARRSLWNALLDLIKRGRSIVLTSHSMEECEALCTRLVIMVNGQFKCVGSTQHLKSRFGRGYTFILKVFEDTDTSPVKAYIQNVFQGAALVEEHQGMLQYQVDSIGLNWSTIFAAIEDKKEELMIAEYSVSQTSLEQVFLNFAKEQHMDKWQKKLSKKLSGRQGSILQRQASITGSVRQSKRKPQTDHEPILPAQKEDDEEVQLEEVKFDSQKPDDGSGDTVSQGTLGKEEISDSQAPVAV
ncbi:phospholipid-transporting ATPase ABCA3-like [Glandiceps talaboti]